MSRVLEDVEQMAKASLPVTDIREYNDNLVIDYENPYVEYDRDEYRRIGQPNPFATGSMHVASGEVDAELVVHVDTVTSMVPAGGPGDQSVIGKIDVKEKDKAGLYDLSRKLLDLNGSCVISGFHQHPDSVHVHVRCAPLSSRRLRDTALSLVDIIEEEVS